MALDYSGNANYRIMRAVTRINPIWLLIVLNIVLVFGRDLLPESVSTAIAATVESTVLSLGVFGYAGIVLLYVLCGFFFVPLLIPLNILGGALYGAWEGTAIALAGITLGTVASTVSARYVFTGMQSVVDQRPVLKRLIAHADRHRNLAIVMVRFTVIVPYLVQNIALAVTGSSVLRITLLTVISAIPGAAIYSFLGAGLVEVEDVTEMLLYLAVPIIMLLGIAGALAWFRSRYVAAGDAGADESVVACED
jgi:uncharacterized membrane protein YdjX (TVP38/TMEM64 family)